jgi:hypothetical protein
MLQPTFESSTHYANIFFTYMYIFNVYGPHFLFSYLLLGCLDTNVSNVRILGKNKILVEKT